MSFDVEEHVIYRVFNAPLQVYPFPHFYVESVFPNAYYESLRSRLPDLERYQRLDETGTVPKGAYPERFVCDLQTLEEKEAASGEGSFWADLADWLMSERFAQAVMAKFSAGITARCGEGAQLRTSLDCRLVRDFSNYAIPPHTDTPRKLVSLLFYLPPNDALSHLGTSIYVAKDRDFTCEGRGHHPFSKFRKAMTAPYRPNSLFAFLKTDSAFHGVERIEDPDVIRDSMLYNIYVEKVITQRSNEPEQSAMSARRRIGEWFGSASR